MSKHPITGRELPKPDLRPGQIEEIPPGALEEIGGELEPWLIFGPWTIYSQEQPTAEALAALIVALAELAKLAANAPPREEP